MYTIRRCNSNTFVQWRVIDHSWFHSLHHIVRVVILRQVQTSPTRVQPAFSPQPRAEAVQQFPFCQQISQLEQMIVSICRIYSMSGVLCQHYSCLFGWNTCSRLFTMFFEWLVSWTAPRCFCQALFCEVGTTMPSSLVEWFNLHPH